MSNKIKDLEKTIDSLENNLSKSKSECSSLNATLQKQNKSIITLQEDWSQKEKEIISKIKEINPLKQTEIQNLQNDINNAKNKIIELESKIRQSDINERNLLSKIDDKNNMINDLK